MAAVTLLGGALLADSDGRSVSYGHEVAMGRGMSTASPFPGSFYGVPAGVGLLVLAVVTALTLRIVANQPAVATAHDSIETALRRASGHRVLRVTVGVALFVTGACCSSAARRCTRSRPAPAKPPCWSSPRQRRP